jgi:hypothetical protein
MKSNVHLIYFYTEDKKLDKGLDLATEAKIFSSLTTERFTSVQGYNPQKLIESGKKWLGVFQDKTSWVVSHPEYTKKLKWNREWAKVNFQAWKPKLILEVLLSDRVKDGDIVYYHDVNIGKYPEYKIGIPKWEEYISSEMILSDVLLFNDNNIDFRSDTKIELIDFFNLGNLTGHHIWSGALAIKKTSLGIDFCREWDLATSNLELVSPFTRTKYRYYHWNAVDQATVTALYHSHNLKKTKVRINCIYLNNSRIIPPLRFPLLGRVTSFFYRKMTSIRALIKRGSV